MRQIGRLLIGLGRMNRRAFVALVAEVTHDMRRRELAHADRSAADPKCPSYWKAALNDLSRHLHESGSVRAFRASDRIHADRSAAAGFQATQGFLVDFGELVMAWPDVWTRARLLNGSTGAAAGRK